ncbi:MAG: GNAT family N-acetyltransferase [Hyphomonadaceae bacterium]|nr:GNAT family N-acetyltransferase [Hyphomonadaceae bacterium]
MSLLDRTVWSSLTTRQSALALGDAARALRFKPDYGMFVAAADASPEARAAMAQLVTPAGAAEVEIEFAAPPPPGCSVVSERLVHQMVMTTLNPAPARNIAIVPLTEADASEMRALAEFTKPGPFFARTHQLGDFVGVKLDGKLAAMAGERMQPTGYTEVSAVCTHPDARGRGFAGVLMSHVCANIIARGEQPFLHTYADNTGAIGLYEKLGFTFRTEVRMRVLVRD